MSEEYPVGTAYQEGGKGSGHFGHAGRPESRGGSTSGAAGGAWNTSKNYGPEAEEAKKAIRDRWNSPPQFSVNDRRWMPRLNSSQHYAMQAMVVAQKRWEQRGKKGQAIPTWKIDGRVLSSLKKREWIDKSSKLTQLGIEVMQEFYPESFDKERGPGIDRPF